MFMNPLLFESLNNLLPCSRFTVAVLFLEKYLPAIKQHKNFSQGTPFVDGRKVSSFEENVLTISEESYA